MEMIEALSAARMDSEVGVIILTGQGEKAFCSGGDQKIRGDAGYIGDDGVPRLNILEVQRQIRTLPKPVIAMGKGAKYTSTIPATEIMAGERNKSAEDMPAQRGNSNSRRITFFTGVRTQLVNNKGYEREVA